MSVAKPDCQKWQLAKTTPFRENDTANSALLSIIILIFQEPLLHGNFKLPDKNFWQARCLGMAWNMAVCVTQLNIFACDYGNFILLVILISIQVSKITATAKNSSLLLDIHTLALHVTCGWLPLLYDVSQSLNNTGLFDISILQRIWWEAVSMAKLHVFRPVRHLNKGEVPLATLKWWVSVAHCLAQKKKVRLFWKFAQARVYGRVTAGYETHFNLLIRDIQSYLVLSGI